MCLQKICVAQGGHGEVLIVAIEVREQSARAWGDDRLIDPYQRPWACGIGARADKTIDFLGGRGSRDLRQTFFVGGRAI